MLGQFLPLAVLMVAHIAEVAHAQQQYVGQLPYAQQQPNIAQLPYAQQQPNIAQSAYTQQSPNNEEFAYAQPQREIVESAYVQPSQNIEELAYGQPQQNVTTLAYGQPQQNVTASAYGPPQQTVTEQLAYAHPPQNIVEITVSQPPENMISDYRPLGQMMVNGTQVNSGEFPYQVSLRLRGRHHCGGVIITRRHILTAAHCVADLVSINNLRVVTGAVSITRGGQIHRPRRVIYHRGYVHSPGPNDIAIVILGARIPFNYYQKAIKLPRSLATTGAMAVVTGWGYSSVAMPEPTNRLQKLYTGVIRAAECQRRSHFGLNTHQICAFAGAGRGTCHLDSGGPLAIDNVLIGIVSFGRPCAQGLPDVFTSVYHYNDWIRYVVSRT